jgi:hypothetical protein
MVRFYVTATADAGRCREAARSREVITITGALEGQLMVFTGTVRRVEDDHYLGLIAWLVTMDCADMRPVLVRRRGGP